mgnify:CR=1 FL=1
MLISTELSVLAFARIFQVGSEDVNDIAFVGQRIKWISSTKKNGTKSEGKHVSDHIKVDQKLCIDGLTEITFDKSLKDDVSLTPSMHTEYRSVLGQLNWLQSRTQFHIAYSFSRCASAAATPTIADVKAINKTVRTVKAMPVALHFWPLKGNLRIIGYPDASYRNNADKSSQRGQVLFLAEARKTNSVDGKGSLIDYESHKINRTTSSTTVSELYAFMNVLAPANSEDFGVTSALNNQSFICVLMLTTFAQQQAQHISLSKRKQYT